MHKDEPIESDYYNLICKVAFPCKCVVYCSCRSKLNDRNAVTIKRNTSRNTANVLEI
jgi:hypothetical protein